MRWLIFLAALTLLAPMILFASEVSESDGSKVDEEDATTQSVRDRGRILLKRNFLASEFQASETVGFYQEAFLDAEGVDSRAFFSLTRPSKNVSSNEVTIMLTQQDKAGNLRPGAVITAERAYGPVTFSAEVARSASDRIIDQYEGRWRRTSEDLSFLSFPAYTRDRISADSNVGNFRVDWSLGGDRLLTLESALTRYQDRAFRTKIEGQFGVGSFDASDPGLRSVGDTITDLAVTDASLRHYQHEWNTQRNIARHQVSFRQTLNSGLFELRAYQGSWENSSQWLPWNFMAQDVDIAYSTDDAYLPSLALLDGHSFVDPSAAVFRDYRYLNTKTRDMDKAVALDWDSQRDWIDAKFVFTIGASWRSKKRRAEDQRWVYQPSGQGVLAMTELVSQLQGASILSNEFSLPPSINHADARRIASDPNNTRVVINEFLSFKESIEQQFASSETVSAAYVHSQMTRSNYTVSLGLRKERTVTNTLGTLSGSEEAIAPAGSQSINEVDIFGVSIVDTFDAFQAFSVPAENQYHQWIPSFSFRYAINQEMAFNLGWHQQIMRPQYFDIVNYSRELEAFRRIDRGNPSLAPARIDTVSGGLSFISGDASIRLELFKKSIDNFAYRSTTAGLVRGEIYRIRSIENGSRASISGAQLAASFSLPTARLPIDKASISLRYTYSDSEALLATRSTAFPERARHFGNASFNISKGPIRLQTRLLGYSRTLESIGEDTWQDQYRSEVLAISHSLLFKTDSAFQFVLSVTNPLDRPERITEQADLRVVKNEFSGSLYKLSISRSL
ncbi:MAG: TonB-dependent receptor [Pseudomonadota bacterium]|nr:TonB-dependent receptor [Pseudomonadota bacterium]MEC8633588.1 TonB-dependent receptor [Pseudomonadota bacterium]